MAVSATKYLIPLLLVGSAFGQLWSGVLASSRATSTWNSAGATITNRTTTCTTVSLTAGTAAATANTAALNNAFISCYGSGNVVIIPTGTWYVNGDLCIIPTSGICGAGGTVSSALNFTVRGAGTANQTKIVFCNSSGASPCSTAGSYPGNYLWQVYNGDSSYSVAPDNVINWTAGYAAGTSSITLNTIVTGSGSHIGVGSALILDQCDTALTGSTSNGNCTGTVADNGNLFICGNGGGDSNVTGVICNLNGNSQAGRRNTSLGQTMPIRTMAQQVTVTSVSGTGPYTVGITPAIYMQNFASGQFPQAWWSTANPASGVGIENLTVDASNVTSGTGGIFGFNNASGDWLKNVVSINNTSTNATHKHVWEYQTNHITVRDSYFYGSAGQAESYGVDCSYGSSDNLIENNIFQHIASPLMMEGCSGSVYGHNFTIDMFFTGNPAGSDPHWQIEDASHHTASNELNLFEGNQGTQFMSEIVFGPSQMTTSFREYWSGFDANAASADNKTEQTNAISIWAMNRYLNIVGDVLGTPTTHTVYQEAASNTTSTASTANSDVFLLGYSNSQGGQVQFTVSASGTGSVVTFNGSGMNVYAIGTTFRITSCSTYNGTYQTTTNTASQIKANGTATGSQSGCILDFLDTDSSITTSLMRWGNWDVVTNAVRFCTANATPVAACTADERGDAASTYPGLSSPSTTLPSSFYLSSKPAFWTVQSGTQPPFPAMGPDVTTGTISGTGSHAYRNPAGNCYLTVLSGVTNGAATALTNFDANTCYYGTPVSPYTITTPGSGYTTWLAPVIGINTYCAQGGGSDPWNGTWTGPTTDGVATLPTSCSYTTPASAPTETYAAGSVCPGTTNVTNNGVCWIGQAGDVIPTANSADLHGNTVDPRHGSAVDYTSISSALSNVGTACGIHFKILPTIDNTPTGSDASTRVYSDSGGDIIQQDSCTFTTGWNALTTGAYSALPPLGTEISPAWVGQSSLAGYPTYGQPTLAGRYLPRIVSASATTTALLMAPGASHWIIRGLEITNGNGQAYNLSLIGRQGGAFGTANVQACTALNVPITGCPASGSYTAVSNVVGTAFGAMYPLNTAAYTTIEHNQYPVFSLPSASTMIINGSSSTSTSANVTAVADLGVVTGSTHRMLVTVASLPYIYVNNTPLAFSVGDNETVECTIANTSAGGAPNTDPCFSLTISASQFTYQDTTVTNCSSACGTVLNQLEMNAIQILNDHIWYWQNVLHGGNTWPNTAGVTHQGIGAMSGDHNAAIDNWIGEIYCGVNQPQSQCVEGQGIALSSDQIQTTSPKIVHNFIAASTEDTILGGSNWDTPATDVEIRLNHFYKPLMWHKGCLGPNPPAFCRGATMLKMATASQTVNINSIYASGGEILVYPASSPTGYGLNVPFEVDGVTGTGFTGNAVQGLYEPANYNATSTGSSVTFTIAPGVVDQTNLAVSSTFKVTTCTPTNVVNLNTTYTVASVNSSTVTTTTSPGAVSGIINCTLTPNTIVSPSIYMFSAGTSCTGACGSTGATISQLVTPDVKNGLELKNGLRVLIEGNIIGNPCTWEGQSDQFGECLHLNMLQGRYGPLLATSGYGGLGDGLLDVTVRYNAISGANKGVIFTQEEAGNVGPAGGNGPTLSPAVGRFSIHDLVIDAIDNTEYGLGSSGTPQLGGICLVAENPFAGPYAPQSVDWNHVTCAQSSQPNASAASSNRAQILSTTDTSGRTPTCTGVGNSSSNGDGTGVLTHTSGCSFSYQSLGYYVNYPTGTANWYQILQWTSATTFRVQPDPGSQSAQNFSIQCASGCSNGTGPATKWLRHWWRNSIATGGAYNGFTGTQSTVGTLAGLFDATSTNGWFMANNILATAGMTNQTPTTPYPETSSDLPFTSLAGCGITVGSCPSATLITSAGCTATVMPSGSAASSCYNPDAYDGVHTTGSLAAIGFTTFTDPSTGSAYWNVLGGTNDYTLASGTPGKAAGSDGADLGANIATVKQNLASVQ